MPRQQIPFSQLNIKTALFIHNQLAAERGVPPLNSWRGSLVDLIKRVAILNTQKPLAKETKTKAKPTPRVPVKRSQPNRDAIIEALSFVSHYEHAKTGERIASSVAWRYRREDLISVGLPYSEVAKRVRKRAPTAKVTGSILRVNAANARKGDPGYERCKLPQKRPHGTKEIKS